MSTPKILKVCKTNMKISILDPAKPAQWTTVKWKLVEKRVVRLQHRISMAALEGNNRKVRNLQRLIVRSLSGRLKAVRQVAQENQGKRTAGIDGVTWTTPDEKFQAAHDLRKKTKTIPLKRLFISKKDGSTRPLGIPTLNDRAKQAIWNLAVLPAVDCKSDSFSYGFRPYRSTWDCFAQIRVTLGKRDSVKWVIDADISKMFDSIDHNWLIQHTPMEKSILKSWLKSGFFAGNEFNPTEMGTPQGGIISPTLANLTLNGLETFLNKRFPVGRRLTTEGKRTGYHRTGIHLIRYADDFLVTGRSARQLKRVQAAIQEFLSIRGLKLHECKTRIVSTTDGFNFLGWHFRKHGSHLIGKVSKESIRSHMDKIKTIIKSNMSVPAMIRSLNSQISGWTNYHRCTDNLWLTWGKMNKYLYSCLWKWACRRHGMKSKTWVFQNYWSKKENRWAFQSSPYTLQAYSARKARIRRLAASVNVFDLRNKEIIEKTWFLKHLDKLDGVRKALWKKQKGICCTCHSSLDPDQSGYVDMHHITPLHKGGSNSLKNLVLVHEHCHYSIHQLDSQKSVNKT
uniref:Putative reverse transcriptase and intron maturase n=1 Tax=Pedinomonas tuberculata TaxID=160064 RepID=A0A097KL86_9CHLO|nr:putative reverse transcriptase and intron maturase [Pedinomonas tuberculata]AIT93954.1 putative reverse transcriptase and intron maturase [Pedinomonas tuberculata]